MRRICGVLLGLAVLLPAAAWAQGPGGPIQQTGFAGQGGVISRHLHPYPVAPCPGGACPQKTFEYIPPDDRVGRHLQAMEETARQFWYRVEYLHWNIKDPGAGFLGAPRLDGDEQGPFGAVEDGVPVGFATQPNASAFDLSNNNGLRFSLGATTRVGDFEADVWVLNQSEHEIVIDPIRRFDLPGDPDDLSAPNFFAATMLMSDGMLSDTTMLLYNQGYRASLRTDVFGTEANFVFNPVTPNQPLTIRPLAGFQYFNYREGLRIAGANEQPDPVDPDETVIFNHRIDSKSLNNVYAPQIGVRAEFVHEYFTIGVTPKFLLGFNRRKDKLGTSELLQLGDSFFEEEERTEFSPGFDLQVDARIHLNEHFSLFAAYQLYVLSNISRPATNIIYDSVGGTEANVRLNQSKDHQVFFDGLTVGAELRFH